MVKSIFYSMSIATTALLLCSYVKKTKLQEKLQPVRFDQLDSLQTIKQKKVVVFIHADWCKYCHQMRNTTLDDERVINLLNSHFYFIDLNAESKKVMSYSGETFKYKPSGGNTGVHELAEQLGEIDGKLNYPTISIINYKNEIIFQYGGLMSNTFFSKTSLKYFAIGASESSSLNSPS